MSIARRRLPRPLAWLAPMALAFGGAVDAAAHGGQFVQPVRGNPATPTSPTPGGWWDANLDGLVALAPAGPVTTEGAAELDRIRQVARERRIVPFLRTVLSGSLGVDADLLAAAVLALAKTASDPADVDRILAMSRDPARPSMILEAAALAPGLLRRTDPTLRFDDRLLDRVRARCLEIYDGETHGTCRVRCLAVLALALLGDQPRPAPGVGAAAVDVPAELLARLAVAHDVEEELTLVTALGFQPAATFAPAGLDALRALAESGAYASKRRPLPVHAQAILSLARVTGPASSAVCLSFVRATRPTTELCHAGMVALGVLAPALDPASRVAAMTEIAAYAEKGNPDTVVLALLSLGRVLSAAMRDGADRLTFACAPATLLVRQIDEGSGGARKVAALAVGIALRPEPPENADGARRDFRRKAVATLAANADEGDPELRGAAMLALGLARDVTSVTRLLALLARRDVDVALRARSATALGLLGLATAEPLAALRAAIVPPVPDGVRREASRALGFLGDVSALPSLLAEVRADGPDGERSRAAVAVAALRRTQAADALIELAGDRSAADLARAIAVAALGVLADPEGVRSLSRLASDLAGSLPGDALGQALSLL